ncbi:MAG: 3-phosphoshikimate 1-carboxyvinyltransferase, partial [Spirochaetota bacterium]
EGAGDCVPFTVQGPISGGRVEIECPTSQYLSSLLLAAPLASRGMEIVVPLLNERPYVELTLDWLRGQEIPFERDGWDRFTVPGGHSYRSFDRRVPADFSSATFMLVAAAMGEAEVAVDGPDMSDSQGDKDVVSILERLGATVRVDGQSITIRGPRSDEPALAGGEIDLNAMPDALPALAVLGTRCGAPLRLVNVPQAREKETDRIAEMAKLIRALGGQADELSDGLVIHPAPLSGGTVDSAGDHRIAMALAVAGLTATGPVTITNAGVADITFPGYFERLRALGATIHEE